MQHIVIAVAFLTLAVGLPIRLYPLLTRERRRAVDDIRSAAADCGWQFRPRYLQRDAASFRIDGGTARGLRWIMTTASTMGFNRGGSVRLSLCFPVLGGDVDLAVLPRNLDSRGTTFPTASISSEAQARIASFSETVASSIGFFRTVRVLRSGSTAFDATYQILALPHQMRQSPIDAALAERFLHWPATAVAPVSVVAWRDPFGFHLQARLPATPNRATISYFLALAEDFCARLPRAATSPAPVGLLDRLIAKLV
jgi:hypothetical protein